MPITLILQSVHTMEDLTHLPSDIQNYMRKLAELDPPIYLTRE